ncbi:MAG: helix-turn-helix domain-containing protein [Bacteroidales bacterium]|nr:helix-turn-helix domain-containing protein [Bacteroidales bacterium]
MEQQQSAAFIAASYVNNTDCHIFLTGKAGTGKTTFLKDITSQTHKNNIVAAPTGVAAINAGGVTLHSLFQLPFGTFVPSSPGLFSGKLDNRLNTPESLKKNMRINASKRQLLREMELLIIDEVSMLRADTLDAIDLTLRIIRKNRNIPFGGIQLLMIGDMQQLPPVVKYDEWPHLSGFYKSAYFFDALALQQSKPVYIELEKIYRQTDQQFIEILAHLRDNELTTEDIQLLNDHYYPDLSNKQVKGAVFLTTHNKQADSINKKHLDQLKGRPLKFHASISGDFPEYYYPVEDTLTLKKDAQVMFIKNDYSGEQKYFNGKIGIVDHIEKDQVIVRFDDGSEPVEVESYTWENKRFSMNQEKGEIEEKKLGEFTHLPLKLAWAITIHKSQGLTFDKAIIDVSKAFAPGQIYVALSRLRSLNGLILTQAIPTENISADKRLSEFASNKQGQKKLKENLKTESFNYTKNYLLRAFDFNDLKYQFQDHINSYTKKEELSEKQKHKTWAIGLKKKLDDPYRVSETFKQQVRRLTINPEKTDIDKIHERVVAAKEYFEPIMTDFSEQINQHIAGLGHKKGTKKYVKELIRLESSFFMQVRKFYKAEQLIKSLKNNTEMTLSDMKTINAQLENKRKHRDSNISINLKAKKQKPVKGASAALSFELYQTKKDIEFIAKERNLAVTTIEGHLTQYVAKGKIPVTDFVEKNKIKQIIKASNAVNSYSISKIKSIMGDEYSYSDIRFAMADYLRTNSKTDN